MNTILSFFQNPTVSIISIVVWAIIIIISLVLEAETAELIAIWFGVGAIPALVCAIADVDIAIQIIVFAVVTVVLILCTRPLVKKFNQKATIPTNVDKLIGMVGKVTKEIPIDGKGEVKVNYQSWTAITNGSKPIEFGAEIVVKEINGNKLVVELVEEFDVN